MLLDGLNQLGILGIPTFSVCERCYIDDELSESPIRILVTHLFYEHQEFLAFGCHASPHAAFQTDPQQLLGLHRELHRQFLEYFLAEAIHDHADGVFGADASLIAIEDLVFTDLAGAGFVFHLGGRVLHFDVREGVGSTAITQQHRIALGVVAGIVCTFVDLHQATVGVLAIACRDAFADDGAAGILAQVNHLGASVGLLLALSESDRVELTY